MVLLGERGLHQHALSLRSLVLSRTDYNSGSWCTPRTLSVGRRDSDLCTYMDKPRSAAVDVIVHGLELTYLSGRGDVCQNAGLIELATNLVRCVVSETIECLGWPLLEGRWDERDRGRGGVGHHVAKKIKSESKRCCHKNSANTQAAEAYLK